MCPLLDSLRNGHTWGWGSESGKCRSLGLQFDTPSANLSCPRTSFPQDKEPRGIIPLENLSVQPVDDPKKPVGAGPQ